jgi:hypothetical protein
MLTRGFTIKLLSCLHSTCHSSEWSHDVHPTVEGNHWLWGSLRDNTLELGSVRDPSIPPSINSSRHLSNHYRLSNLYLLHYIILYVIIQHHIFILLIFLLKLFHLWPLGTLSFNSCVTEKWHQKLLLIILATWEAEIGRIVVQSQPRQIVWEILSRKYPTQKGLVEWLKR